MVKLVEQNLQLLSQSLNLKPNEKDWKNVPYTDCPRNQKELKTCLDGYKELSTVARS